jgi:hypothetical protein
MGLATAPMTSGGQVGLEWFLRSDREVRAKEPQAEAICCGCNGASHEGRRMQHLGHCGHLYPGELLQLIHLPSTCAIRATFGTTYFIVFSRKFLVSLSGCITLTHCQMCPPCMLAGAYPHSSGSRSNEPVHPFNMINQERPVDDPLFSPDEITVDERIDYVASVRERTILFTAILPSAEAPLANLPVAATGTDDRCSGS